MTIAALRHLRWEVHQSSTLQALPGRVISMISNQTATYASLLLVPRIWIWSRIPSNQRKVLVFLSPMHLLRSIRRCNLIFLNLLHQPNRNPPNMIASSRKDWPIMVSDWILNRRSIYFQSRVWRAPTLHMKLAAFSQTKITISIKCATFQTVTLIITIKFFRLFFVPSCSTRKILIF